MTAYPGRLRTIAWTYLALSFACALIIILAELRRPQKTM